MSRVATVRCSVLCKYIVGQMGYCSHLWDDLVTHYVLFSPYLRSKLLVLFLTDAASCSSTLVAFPAEILKLFSASSESYQCEMIIWNCSLCVHLTHVRVEFSLQPVFLFSYLCLLPLSPLCAQLLSYLGKLANIVTILWILSVGLLLFQAVAR